MTYHECTDVEHLMVLNAVFRNLLFINLFRYIIADDNLLEKTFGTPRKNHCSNKISHFGVRFSKRICYNPKKG